MMSGDGPRIAPGSRKQIGLVNSGIVTLLGRATGGAPPNLFPTLARHRGLFRRWLRFAGALMPGGSLPRDESEILILRVAHNTGCEYEWRHHERIGRAAGLTREEIERVREGPGAEGWSPRRTALLRAADELHAERRISDELWPALAAVLSEPQLIELCMLVGHYEMLAMTLNSLAVEPDEPPAGPPPRAIRLPRRAGAPYRHREGPTVSTGSSVSGRRVLITGAARGIGKLTALRLHQRGARVALIGIEPELLEQAAADCGNAPWERCDVSDRGQVDAAVERALIALGGLDVVIANAGVGAQLPIVGGDPEIFEKTIAVNLVGTYYTVRAAGPHISHPNGYALLTASLAAAVHPPLMGAYSASKAGVEALGDALRAELRPAGARVGIAYYAELDTDMTARAFSTEAAARSGLGGHGRKKIAPVEPAIDAIERAIARRSRRVVSPAWGAAVLPLRAIAQPLVELVARRGLAKTLEIARSEKASLTTPQADETD